MNLLFQYWCGWSGLNRQQKDFKSHASTGWATSAWCRPSDLNREQLVPKTSASAIGLERLKFKSFGGEGENRTQLCRSVDLQATALPLRVLPEVNRSRRQYRYSDVFFMTLIIRRLFYYRNNILTILMYLLSCCHLVWAGIPRKRSSPPSILGMNVMES